MQKRAEVLQAIFIQTGQSSYKLKKFIKLKKC